MSEVKLSAHEREAPHSHLIQGLSPVIFLIVWIFDSYLLNWTTQLNLIVPFIVRIILFGVFMIFAIYLVITSHGILFKDHDAPHELIRRGVLNHVRNPMYLGIMLIYVACICLSISLISLGVFLVIFVLYNKLVNFEEKILEQLFGEDFLKYKSEVPRWIPKF